MSNATAPAIDMQKWGDRQATDLDLRPARFDTKGVAKPIAIEVSADDVTILFARHADRFGRCNPNVFNQFLLERFKAAGAPVEGTIAYRLSHGAIARVKPDPGVPQDYFQYLWLPVPYAVGLATQGERVA